MFLRMNCGETIVSLNNKSTEGCVPLLQAAASHYYFMSSIYGVRCCKYVWYGEDVQCVCTYIACVLMHKHCHFGQMLKVVGKL